MQDNTDHNRLAAQMAERQREEYVAVAVAQTAAFEKRARGDAPRKPKRAQPATPSIVRTAPAASVAQQEQPSMSHGSNVISLLQPAVSSSAFLKAGVLGFQGGGKTLTSALALIGLYKHTLELGLHDGSKPVAMFDTEKGSDWLIPIFKKAGVPFVVAKRQAFVDLLKVMDEAEKSAFGLLIDSVTHPWRELVESYLRKKERSYLAMDDWGYLKGEHGWKQFTDRFVNSKVHIVMAGRAGHEYENYVEDGRKKMEKVGTKMKTEGETGYEPDLLILMEQVEDLRSGKVVHRATIQKDRSTLLDGQTFDLASYDIQGKALSVDMMVRQTFAAIQPHVQCLALGQPHIGVNTTGDSQHILKTEKRDWTPVQRDICIDEIQTLLALHYPSQSADDKKAKLKAVLKHFDAVWTEIEKVMPLPDLRAGYDSLHLELEGKPSKYGSAIKQDATAAAAVLDDALPDFAAAAG
ncbi:MAG: AAA family ATPase [bacterium]|nr:AAA family ATPase [bacterium]